MNHNSMIRRLLLTLCILISTQSPSNAQANLRKEDLCPDYSEIDPLLECLTVDSYAGLAEVIENAPSGSEITLCPFFLRKVTSVKPITVNIGVRVHCARTIADQFCTIIGFGNHLVIDTAEDTMWQGFSFRGSNDHAVHISGEVENAELATHTFCQTSFMENVRTKDTRGGALMLQRSAGTVNVVDCFFQENFSKTFGAAIYSRTSQLNIIYSLFVKNKSSGYGSAVYTASDGGLMIKKSSFKGNNGREGHDIVFNPGTGKSTYEDGFDNSVNDGDCRGVYDSVSKSCIVFEKSLPTPFPTIRSTSMPTSNPTLKPNPIPTKAPTQTPTPFPTIRSTSIPTSNPTLKPNPIPTKAPTQTPTGAPSIKPTTKIITAKPTRPPIVAITKNPVEVITVPPTLKPVTPPPTKNPTTAPIEIVASKPSGLIGTTFKPPTMMPTPRTTDTTGSIDPVGGSVGGTASGLCLFRMIPTGRRCTDVKSFEDFKAVIESGRSDIIFCGGFYLHKIEPEPVKIARNIDIRCVDRCSFFGVGPFLEISGAMSKIRFKNFKFMNSRDSSAVIVSTISSVAETTFCDTEFTRNQVAMGNNHLGGALTIESRSGVVNVVNNTFTGNIASRGGAIHSNGLKLNVVGSKFVANNAYHSGNAIFVGAGNHLSVQSSTFILNTEVPTRVGGHEGREPDSSVAIAVQPDKSIRDGSRRGTYTDGGSNQVILSGTCDGFYNLHNAECDDFKPMTRY